MKKFLCAVMALLMIFAASCGGEKQIQSGEKDAKSENKSGGSITIYSLKDDTLCPILTDNEANKQMLCIVYEALVRVKDNLEAEGVLASKWSVSEDGLTWTFALRSGVKWHSGEALSAQDVVYTVEQIKKNEQSPYISNVSRIASVHSDGATKVIFTLNEPCANFVNLMTFPIVKSQSTDIDREGFVPCGTGAYVFSDKNEGNMYYLLKNNAWWGGEAKLDEIKVRLLPDSETVMYSLSAGNIDIANTERGVLGRFSGSALVRKSSVPTTVYDFIGINHKNTALSQTAVRRAISLAVDRNKIVDDIFAGNACAANSPVRDEWFFAEEEKEELLSSSEDAERLLLKDGWKKSDGIYRKRIDKVSCSLKFDLLVNEENTSKMNMAESVKMDLESAGMEINVIPLSYEEYESRIASGNYELFIGSFMFSEEMDYRFLLGEGNMFGYEKKKLRELMDLTQTAKGKENIIESYQNFSKKFNSEVPVAGLCFENFEMLIKKSIGGKLNNSQGNIYDGIYNLYIEEQENG